MWCSVGVGVVFLTLALAAAHVPPESGGSGLLQHDQLQEVSQPEEMNLDTDTDIKDHENCSSSNLAALGFTTTSQPITVIAAAANNCCFDYYPRILSKKYIISYSITDKRCPMPGIIFTTRKLKTFCVDPKEVWVENVMNAVDKVSL